MLVVNGMVCQPEVDWMECSLQLRRSNESNEQQHRVQYLNRLSIFNRTRFDVSTPTTSFRTMRISHKVTASQASGSLCFSITEKLAEYAD